MDFFFPSIFSQKSGVGHNYSRPRELKKKKKKTQGVFDFLKYAFRKKKMRLVFPNFLAQKIATVCL